MQTTRRFSLISLILFIGSHLMLIPVLSFFGLQTFPILYEKGFVFGCLSAAPFALTVILLQGTFLFCFSHALKKWPKFFLRKPLLAHCLPLLFLFTHFANFYFNSEIYADSLIEITPNASAVYWFVWMCMSMISITTWQWLETELLFLTRHKVFKDSISQNDLFQLWLIEQKNKIVPALGMASLFGGYFALMFVQQTSWDNPQQILAKQKENFLYLVGVVAVWQMVIYYFDFYKNRVLSREAESHLKCIQSQNFKFRSNTFNSGFFSVIFNVMNGLSEALAKKGRLLKGFSAFVSDSTTQGHSPQDNQSYSGDSKKVAIMMTEIRNFTSIAALLKPQDVVDMLNIYFSDMIEVFVENGIVVDKFIGDGILAYAIDEGSPLVYENMLKTAFDMQLKLVSTNMKLRSKKLPKIQLSIGLHEGAVVLGTIGTKDKLQHTIIGDPVNITTRLEELCKEKYVGLIVSTHFLNKVNPKHRSKFTNFGSQKIRGLDLPIEIQGALAYETRKNSTAA
ncbi:MAG: adenylate/guanylate cyclase domain-containing protein [Bdellovibrionaceae bacterium]|nr:adenylate/guanylate cyclase domain-containing protein [Pseudobdellovibrionaceae bacterium]